LTTTVWIIYMLVIKTAHYIYNLHTRVYRIVQTTAEIAVSTEFIIS